MGHKMWWQRASALTFLFIALCGHEAYCQSQRPPQRYNVGVGISDITGPAAELGMMGYASPSQVAKGIHMRLFSRAFIFDSGEPNGRIVFVSADLAMIGQAVKLEVARKLGEKYGDMYTSKNVLLSATHTHSGPAGYMQYALHGIASNGFVEANFDAIVDGIVESISYAHEKMVYGYVYLTKMKLENELEANINRSPTAYNANPSDEKARYPDGNTDKDMVLLRIDNEKGEPLGSINWYAVHPTSMNNTNRLISGDNKGYASQLFEKHMNYNKTTVLGRGGFVAAFASSNLGDVSPNINGPMCINTGEPCDLETSSCGGYPTYCIASGPDPQNMKESTRIIGERQFTAAWQLFETAADETARMNIYGDVQFAHQYINMTNYKTTYTVQGVKRNVTTCPGALGYSFAAGTTDGPGAFNFTQGATTDNPFWNLIRDLLQAPSLEQIQCHEKKPILLDVGETFFPYPWIPAIVETQMLRLGNLFIVGVPGELTTMAGRRMRDTIKDTVKAVDPNMEIEVVVAGLSNIYTHYITTYEEYQIQRYEGASTLYGPFTLAAYQQQFSMLTDSMMKNATVEPGPPPPYLVRGQISLNPPIILDRPPFMRKFGQCTQQPYAAAYAGEIIKATFVAGHLRNNPMRKGTFILIERKETLADGSIKWVPEATDADWSTELVWRRTLPLLPYSEVEVTWETSALTPPGYYRIRHVGYYKPLMGAAVPYDGQTWEFRICKASEFPRCVTNASQKVQESNSIWSAGDLWRIFGARQHQLETVVM